MPNNTGTPNDERVQATLVAQARLLAADPDRGDAIALALKNSLPTLTQWANAARPDLHVEHDHYQEDAVAASVVEAWREHRVRWLTDPALAGSVYDVLVDHFLQTQSLFTGSDGLDDESILDRKIDRQRVGARLHRMARLIFGDHHAQGYELLAQHLVGQTIQLTMAGLQTDIRSALSHTWAEFVYVPGWDGHSVDDMIYNLGIRTRHWGFSPTMDELVPSTGLANVLRWLNIGTDDLFAACLRERPGEAAKLAESLAGWRVERRCDEPTLLRPSDLIGVMENSRTDCVAMYHCEINLAQLLDAPLGAPLRLATRQGKIHIGLHDPINGAGYMDTWPGEVVIPADATGFGWVGRWPHGIDKTYGLVRSALRAEVRPLAQQAAPTCKPPAEPDAQALAERFRLRMAMSLPLDKRQVIDRGNQAAGLDSIVCTSHDAVDANRVMAEAFAEVVGHPSRPDSDDDARLWNRAWLLAKRAGFAQPHKPR